MFSEKLIKEGIKRYDLYKIVTVASFLAAVVLFLLSLSNSSLVIKSNLYELTKEQIMMLDAFIKTIMQLVSFVLLIVGIVSSGFLYIKNLQKREWIGWTSL